MKFDGLTMRVVVRKDYGACYDFYTKVMGLVPVYGDRNGPYTSFATKAGGAGCFAIFAGANMDIFKGYNQPQADTQPDTALAVISTDKLDEDYQRLKNAGVEFVSEPQFIAGWEMRCTYFRDPEGNLFELNDATSV